MHCQRLAPIGFHGSDQVVLDLPLDRFEPLLRTICAILEVLYLFVKLRYPILRSPQLYGEPVRLPTQVIRRVRADPFEPPTQTMQPGKCLGGCRPRRRYPGAQRGGKRAAVVGVLERGNQCSAAIRPQDAFLPDPTTARVRVLVCACAGGSCDAWRSHHRVRPAVGNLPVTL